MRLKTRTARCAVPTIINTKFMIKYIKKMGWIARLFSGEMVRERDNIRWDDVNIHLIESLWLEGFEKYKISRNNIKNVLEFIQFKTAEIDVNGKVNIESRCIGWSNGEKEFILRINEKTGKASTEIIERIHFHPLSIFNNRDCDSAKRKEKK